MSHRQMTSVGALLVLGLAVTPVATGAGSFGAHGSRTAVPIIRWTIPGFARDQGSPVGGMRDPLTAELQRSEGWDVYGFEVADSGLGLFLELTGSVEFRLARVTFTDGTVQDLDLRDARRSDGLFELVTFPDTERIDAVSLVARARSRQAKIAVRIGR